MNFFIWLSALLRTAGRSGETAVNPRDIRREQIGRLRAEASKCAEKARNLAQSGPDAADG